MSSTVKATNNLSKKQDLIQPNSTNESQLVNIKSHLDLVLLALEAIAEIGSEEIVQAATALKLEAMVGDRLTLWRLRASNPQRHSTGGRKKLDVEEARSLVLIICHLAQQHRELLRRAVTLLEQVTEQNQPPHQTALLGDYVDRFIDYYQARITAYYSVSLADLAFKLLINLLFYSSDRGHRLLWAAIFDAAQTAPKS